jgi:hypothetical protein
MLKRTSSRGDTVRLGTVQGMQAYATGNRAKPPAAVSSLKALPQALASVPHQRQQRSAGEVVRQSRHMRQRKPGGADRGFRPLSRRKAMLIPPDQDKRILSRETGRPWQWRATRMMGQMAYQRSGAFAFLWPAAVDQAKLDRLGRSQGIARSHRSHQQGRRIVPVTGRSAVGYIERAGPTPLDTTGLDR